MTTEEYIQVRDIAFGRVDELAEQLADAIRTAVQAEDDYYRGRPRFRVDSRPYVRHYLIPVMHRLRAAQEPRS